MSEIKINIVPRRREKQGPRPPPAAELCPVCKEPFFISSSDYNQTRVCYNKHAWHFCQVSNTNAKVGDKSGCDVCKLVPCVDT